MEMKTLTAISVAAQALYDMLKAADKAMVIEGVRVLEKSSGRSRSTRPSGSSRHARRPPFLGQQTHGSPVERDELLAAGQRASQAIRHRRSRRPNPPMARPASTASLSTSTLALSIQSQLQKRQGWQAIALGKHQTASSRPGQATAGPPPRRVATRIAPSRSVQGRRPQSPDQKVVSAMIATLAGPGLGDDLVHVLDGQRRPRFQDAEHIGNGRSPAQPDLDPTIRQDVDVNLLSWLNAEDASGMSGASSSRSLWP